MTIVLDTHIWLWWLVDPSRLSAAARRAIDEADVIAVSAISCWEVGMLMRRGRIRLDREINLWIRHAVRDPRVEPIPVTAEVAVEAGILDDRFSGDPADRIIYATALLRRCPLVTADRRLHQSAPDHTIW